MPHPFADLGTPILAALGAPDAITRTRYAPSSYALGVHTAGAPTTVTVPAVVQPVKPRELLQVPENERTEEAIAIFTALDLRTGTPAGQMADQIAWGGRNWKVVLLEDWSVQAGYYRAIATRLGQ